MGKINFHLICREKDKVKDLEAYVYVDDSCVGKARFFEPLSFTVNGESALSVCINGSFSKEIIVPNNENYDIIVEYAYYADSVCKMEIRDSKGNVVTPNANPVKSKSSADSNSKQNYVCYNEAKDTDKSMFGKLKKVGGWVHTLFRVLFALMIMGVLISFVVLLANELPDIACIVFGGGLGAVVIFYLEYLLAGYFYFAARDKGYTDLMYLFFPWVFPVIGHLLIAALPDRGNGRNHEKDKE